MAVECACFDLEETRDVSDFLRQFDSPLSFRIMEQALAGLDYEGINWPRIKETVGFALSEDDYARIALFRNQICTLLCLHWPPEVASPIHNHRGSNCSLKLIKGKVGEMIYTRSEGNWKPDTHTTLAIDETCSSHDLDTHQVANEGDSEALTIHLYSPPLDDMECFGGDFSTYRRALDTVMASKN